MNWKELSGVVIGALAINVALIFGLHVHFGWWGWLFWAGVGVWWGVLKSA